MDKMEKTEKDIVMYVRTSYCPLVALARDVMQRYKVPYREINIDDDSLFAARIKEWTHHYSVPTIIITNPDEEIPSEEFLPRPTEWSIKGYDRGPMITEPNNQQLEDWLHKHGFLAKPYRR